MVLRVSSKDCCDGKHGEGKHVPKIDIHTHIIPETWPNWNDRFGYTGWLHIQHDPSQPVNGPLGGSTLSSGRERPSL